MKKSFLEDNFGRKHNYLRISLTERCNLRCTYCMPCDGVELSPKENIMTADEIIAIAQSFVDLGVTKIRLTGGEPLIKKSIHKIMDALAKMNVELTITTNGVILDRFVDHFKKWGVKNINISLDTLDRDKFNIITRRDDFERVMKNIYLMVAEGFKVKINNVLIKDFNESEIIPFIELSKSKNIHIRFIEFMPFDGNNWDAKKLVSHQQILDLVSQHYGKENIFKATDSPNDTARHYNVKDFKGTFAIISTVTNPFCDSCNRIRLTANGRLKNCLFSNNETDILTPFRAGQELGPVIQEALSKKFKVRGGLTDDIEFKNADLHKNRSMIMIGG